MRTDPEHESLFEEDVPSFGADSDAPLAARMRPTNLDEIVGQSHLTAPEAAFRRMLESGKLSSVIFWGPPGVGKTTLADVIARIAAAHFVRMSAVSAGVADLRKAASEASRRRRRGKRTILFIDEIHRFNKSQQDAILPYVEDGTVVLIGATTENPSFEVNSALLSRSRVYVLKPLSDDDIGVLVDRALGDPERGLAEMGLELAPEAREAIVNFANGDGRSALNMLELCASAATGAVLDLDTVTSAVQKRSVLYDKGGESHFDLISALHKCVRDSDPDAAIYWLARMLAGGEDPLYLARRLVRMSVEDVGLADPMALQVAMAAQQAIHFLGQPEGELALAQCAVFMACAPKSNRVYLAYGKAQRDVESTRNDPVPMHLRNAPTRLMKEMGYGAGYQYAHDAPDAVVDQKHLPENLAGRTYYEPSDRGYEAKIAQRLKLWKDAIAARAPNGGVLE